MDGPLQPHNQRSASVWGSGGVAYDEISHQISSALDHCVRRLDLQPGERVLDLATGTGWTSRLMARCGADVTGTDIASGLLAIARERAKTEGLSLTYEVGDAEKLIYPDASFDAIASTFGVMFATRPEAVASEMARVCRKGGRIGLATWSPDSSVRHMFEVMRTYMPSPPTPAPPSPFAWGRRERIQELLGDAFDLAFEEGTTVYYDRDGTAAWAAFVTGYGPTKALAANLDEVRRKNLEQDFVAFHNRFMTPLGIAVPRQYLLTIGTRRPS